MNPIELSPIQMKSTAYPAWYARLVWLLLPLCAVVFIEPAPYEAFMLLACAIAIYHSYMKFSSYMSVPMLFIGIFLVCNMIPLLFVREGLMQSMKYFMVTLYLIISWLFFIGLLNQFKESILKIIFSGYMAAALFATTIGLLAYLHIIPDFGIMLKYDRIMGLFKDPNVFGPFLVPGVVIALHYMVTKPRRTVLLWIGVFIFLIIGVLFSYSRAAWGNCFIACGAYLLFPYKASLKKRLLMLFAVMLTLIPVLVYVISSPSINTMFVDRFAMKKYDDDRFGTQAKALEEVLEKPLGIGPGQSELVYSYATHSLYVRVLTEYGVVGFTVFALFMVFTIYRSFSVACLRGSPYNTYFIVFFACLLGLMFNSFFIDTLHWRHFWLLFAFPWMPHDAIKPHFPRKEGFYENRTNHHTL
ncbi:O-antigen ligase family protein [Paenibacillus sp. N1-5-1-14]|uniref:O-antigen ligase family protein n=1 Tax=Paenibacillus radicibacter TaxID=2972488 RepID=UPI002158A901|nr:O-antigen ligase family protein [Paenibacillus radicibacter]MCR8641081.1 O-antigen ligase family protein [Paenibacillus radicibacter]